MGFGRLGVAVESAGPYANNLHLVPKTTTRHHSIFTDRMLFLTPNMQQCQSPEGTLITMTCYRLKP